MVADVSTESIFMVKAILRRNYHCYTKAYAVTSFAEVKSLQPGVTGPRDA